jgi:hypothetical protein
MGYGVEPGALTWSFQKLKLVGVLGVTAQEAGGQETPVPLNA